MRKRIAVVGASGRTGRFVVSALRDHPELSLGAALVSEGSSVKGESVFDDITYTTDLNVIAQCDGVIDFSTPETALLVAELCASNRKPLLVGTTGSNDRDSAKIQRVSEVAPLLVASNTSVGAAVLGIVAESAREMLGSAFDVEVFEIHHNRKKDAPSGTARSLVEGLIEKGEKVAFQREGLRVKDEIGVASLRGGDVVGDHTIYFLGEGERLELKHQANDRRIFGSGAVTLMAKLLDNPAGIYTVRDLLVNRSQ